MTTTVHAYSILMNEVRQLRHYQMYHLTKNIISITVTNFCCNATHTTLGLQSMHEGVGLQCVLCKRLGRERRLKKRSVPSYLNKQALLIPV